MRRKAGLLLVVAWLAGASGCAGAGLAPSRGLPVAVPAALSDGAASGEAAGRLERGEPLTLGDVITLAIQRNADLAAAAERVAEAEARLGEATAAFLPDARFGLAFARTDQAAQAFGMIVSQGRFAPTLDVNDPGATQNVRPELAFHASLFRGGQDYYRREASRLGVEVAALQRDAVLNALVDAAASAYFAVVVAPEYLDVARSSVAAVEEERRIAEERLRQGAGLRSDVLSLEAEVAAAREREIRARNGTELARAALARLLVLPPGTAITAAPAPDVEAPEGDAASLVAAALERRPEIAMARRVVEMREAEVQGARGAYWPGVDLFANYGHDGRDLRLYAEQASWAFGVALAWDPLSLVGTSQRVEAAEHRLAAARREEEAARAAVVEDVERARIALDEARELERVAEAGLAAAEEAQGLVGAQYQAGAAIVTRYLDAEAARTDARTRRIAARLDRLRASVGLRRAIGDLP